MQSFKLLLPIVLFAGCCKETPKFPKMDEVETTSFSWEDITYGKTLGHFLTPEQWQVIQEEMIDRRYKANTCIKLTKPYQGQK